MKKTRMRLWSLLLTVAMVLTLLPATALAEETPGEETLTPEEQEFSTDLHVKQEPGLNSLTEEPPTAETAEEVFLAAIAQGGTVTLTDNLTLAEGLTISKDNDVVLDLGGKTLTLSGTVTVQDGAYETGSMAGIANEGTLTIKNGTVTSSAVMCLIINSGELTLEDDVDLTKSGAGNAIDNLGGTVVSDADVTLSNTDYTAIVTYGGRVTINGGEIKADTGVSVFNRWYDNESAGAEVVVNGGSIQSKKFALSTNNIRSGGSEPSNVTIKGGNLTSTNATVVYWPSAGTLKIGSVGGNDTAVQITAENGSAIEVCSGTLIVNSGTLRGSDSSDALNASGSWAGAYRKNSGCAGLGDAVTIIARRGAGYDTAPLNVAINGGNFTSSDNYAVRYFDCNEVSGAAQITQDVSVSISGGTFNFTGTTGGSAVDAEIVSESDQAFITGGTFSSEPDKSYIATGYDVREVSGGYQVGQPVTVTFVNEGETVATEDNVFAGDRVTAPAVSKDGYTLKGWAKEDGTVVDLTKPVISSMTLYAQWEAETYTVTFDANGGSAVENVTVSYRETVTEPAEPTWEGHAFLGWYTEDGELYDFNAPVTGDLTLTAKWNEVVADEETPAGVDEIQVAPSAPVIDDSSSVPGADAVIDALEEGVEQSGGVTDAAKDLATDSAYMAEIAAQAKAELETAENVTLVVETKLNISVTDVNDGDSFTLDITPTYSITAIAAGKDPVTIVENKTLPVTKSVTLTIPLPESFANAAALFVHHLKNNRTYVYDGEVAGDKLTFTNPHGFSQFTISRTGPEASVDGVQYATLQEAIDAVENRGTVTVHQSGLYAQVSGVKTFWVVTDTGVEMPQLYAAPGYTLSKDGNKYTVRVRTIDDPDNDYELPTWDITVEDSDNGDVEVSPEEAKPTTTITITVTPDKGYAVAEVVVTAENGKEITVTDKGNGKYTFSMPNSDVTIEVTFQPVSGGAAGSDLTITAPTGWVNPFTDVAANAWYYDAVGYANANGLMGGTSATTFAPNGAMNRSMVWTVIARLAGQTISGANWAEDAKAWAVAQGVSDGTNPDGNVTREELVTMLYRYIGSPVMNVPELGLINSYPDAASVSDWAQDAFAWALSRGIIDGRDGKLASGESVTRAEAATILARFHLLTK